MWSLREKKRFESSAKRIKDEILRRPTEIADINKKKEAGPK